MAAGGARAASYCEALHQVVRPGATVIDLGSGPGILSIVALDAGARSVVAIDPDPSIQLANVLAEANGYADRLDTRQVVSVEVTDVEPADVIVSDLRGVLPLLQHHIPSIADARNRLLKPGGTLIPREDTVWAALVDSDEAYRRYVDPWRQNSIGIDLLAIRSYAVNSWSKVELGAGDLAVPPQPWAVLDYSTIEDPNVSQQLTWRIDHPVTTHGVVLWFDSTLAAGVGFSNAPGEPPLIYGQAFFPWSEPVSLLAADEVRVLIGADLVGDEYVWTWELAVDRDERTITSLRQSSFNAELIDLPVLHRRSSESRPALSIDGQRDLALLLRMDGRRSLEEIASSATREETGLFPDWQAAFTRAGDLAVRYFDRVAPPEG
jgi:protein arginine N-methyltransferase 1